jgi:hypothetical protein
MTDEDAAKQLVDAIMSLGDQQAQTAGLLRDGVMKALPALQLLAVPAVAGVAIWALHALFPEEASGE